MDHLPEAAAGVEVLQISGAEVFVFIGEVVSACLSVVCLGDFKGQIIRAGEG